MIAARTCRTTLFATGALLLGWLSLFACENDYPIPKTACDDWCLATQRANCEEDWPEKCVSGCAFGFGPDAIALCGDLWQELLSCYQAASDSDFYCRNDVSQPKDGVCEPEREAYRICQWASADGCEAFCASVADRCGIDSCPIHCDSERCRGEALDVLDCLWESGDLCEGLEENTCAQPVEVYKHCSGD